LRLGVRGKVVGISLLLIGLVALAPALVLETQLRLRLEQRIEAELLRHARSIEVMLSAGPGLDTVVEVDALADRLGHSTTGRVTLIALDGEVLGDSEQSLEQLEVLENHGKRPEVLAAYAHGHGVSRRYSTTLSTEMLYVAVPLVRDGQHAGVVRVSTPLSEVDQAIGQLRLLLMVVGALGLVLAVVVSGVASQVLTRQLRQLLSRVRGVRDGPRVGGHSEPPADDLGSLAGSFNQLAKELDRAISELAHERDRLQTILQGMTGAVVALDGDKLVTLVNEAGLALLDLDEPPIGEALTAVVDVPALADLIARARDRSAPAVEFDTPGDPPRRVLARAAPLKVTGGTVLVMQDVTEMRRLENIRRDFVANVSHELRTPVSVIRANAETLLAGALEEPGGREFLAAIERNADRLTALIADLLDLSRIEAGSYRLETEPVDLTEAFARAIDAVAEVRARRDVDITMDLDGKLRVQADPGGLDQILLNLLDNAVKYCALGGRVELRAAAGEKVARIEVHDDGPGIEERYRERIFERFFRVDKGRSRDAGGTGLGLAIVKHLTDAMDGAVGVMAGTGQGTVFWVELPLAG